MKTAGAPEIKVVPPSVKEGFITIPVTVTVSPKYGDGRSPIVVKESGC
jgi:hypothetical protein